VPASVPSFIIVRPPRLVSCRAACAAQACFFRPPYPVARDRRPVGLAAYGCSWRGTGLIYVQSNDYWSGTEYAPNPNNAWNFNSNDGNQNNDDKNNALYAVAVHPGG